MNRDKIEKKAYYSSEHKLLRHVSHAVIISKSVKFLVYSCYHLKQTSMPVK